MTKKLILALTTLTLFLVNSAWAADFNIAPSTGQLGLKQEFSINIKIDTVGSSINAAQGKIKFSPDILEVQSISKDASVFNFWLQEPTFSNSDGVVEFIGGTPNGVSGASLQVLKINFVSKGVGKSDFSFVDSSITAADGSGTNVLGKANGTSFTVSSTVVLPKTEKSSEVAPLQLIPVPIQIKRTPIKVAGLPAEPVVRVSLYPKQDKWYNFVSQFTPAWKLPPDISGLSTALNTNPNFVAPTVSEGLFESKTFPAISKDGIYYFHVRFQNNVGWGPTTHYRMAVDTQPPVSFKTQVKTGLSSDDPSPKLSFATADSMSGIDHSEVTINSGEPVIVNNSEYALLPHPPGDYLIKVQVYDVAGNSIEDLVKVEILPIVTPKITYTIGKVIIGTDDRLVVKGTAISSAMVVVNIEDKDKFLAFTNEVLADKNGDWEFRLDKELRRGDYLVRVSAKDSRGALSLPTEPVKVSFVEKPVLVLFGLSITLRDLIIILVVIGVLAALWFWRKTLLRLARSQRESIIISRDLKNTFETVKKDLDKIGEIVKKDAPTESKELEFKAINKKVEETLDKTEKYLDKDIEKLE